MIGLPDPERGERVCAVEPNTRSALELDEIAAFCQEAGLMTRRFPNRSRYGPTGPGPGRARSSRRPCRANTARRERPDRAESGSPGPPRPRVEVAPCRRRPRRTAAVTALPDLVRLHRQHLPLPHGRGHHPEAGRTDRSLRRTDLGSHLDVRSAWDGPVARGRADAPPRRRRPGPGRAIPATLTWPTSSRPRTPAGSISWWRSTAGISRRCAASGWMRTGSPSSAPSTRPPGWVPTFPTPITATMPWSTSASKMIEASCVGLVATLATHWDTLGAA